MVIVTDRLESRAVRTVCLGAVGFVGRSAVVGSVCASAWRVGEVGSCGGWRGGGGWRRRSRVRRWAGVRILARRIRMRRETIEPVLRFANCAIIITIDSCGFSLREGSRRLRPAAQFG